MRHSLNLPIFAVALLVCFKMQAGVVTTSYEVTVNGQKITVDADVATNVTVGGKDMAIKVKETGFKKFDDGAISFLFPSTHGVETDSASEYTNWTLDGQDNVMMIYRLKRLEPDKFSVNLIQDLTARYGAALVKIETCEGVFGSQTVKGKKITAKLVGSVIVQEVFSLGGKTGGYVFLIQDGGEKESAETHLVKAKLKETFKLKLAPPR